jgi:hypothetical protein
VSTADPAGRWYGLFSAADFCVAGGNCDPTPTAPAAYWYFRSETIAVPKPGVPTAGFGRGVPVFEDLRRWEGRLHGAVPVDAPPLVWVAAPHALADCTLASDGGSITCDGRVLEARFVAPIPLNRSYANAASVAFLAARGLDLRGELSVDGFSIRSVWPRDFRLATDLPLRPLPDERPPALALRALMREVPQGGATRDFAAWRLWERKPAATMAGKPVLAFIVNGAQGDDDEAHGGHFAIATGRIGTDGGIGDWLVSDFYTLDSESEKGIIAAPVPLDNYLGDLNAGQAWYRPSAIVVAVLADPAAAQLVQSALGRVYQQFYRHQLVYYHPNSNCTSISIDTLCALGMKLARRAADAPCLAAFGFPWLVVRERSLAKAGLACDYASADPVRLFPAAALEEIVTRLFALVDTAKPEGSLETWLARDLDALLFARVPQIPSSRAWGDAPVVTLAEYRSRLPSDPRDFRIVPVPARPFPAALRDSDLLPPPLQRSDVVAAVWGALLLVGIPGLLRAAWRRWRARRRSRLSG